MPQEWVLNTSNQGKAKEFTRLFAQYGTCLTILETDLEEIDADPITVVVHKASQLNEKVLVEDTSLEIEDAKVGIHIRWLLDHLEHYVGRKAKWRALLAYRKDGLVHIFEGKISGSIVSPKGKQGFGFDSFFLPDESKKTLAEEKPDRLNARAKAVESLLRGVPIKSLPCISSWPGPWQ